MLVKHSLSTNVMGLIAAGAVVLGATASAWAQVKTQQTVTEGKGMQTVTVERGEVVWVSGNNLMVRNESDGQLRYFPDVPTTARAMVDGKQLSVTDLKPGMKLSRTTITTTTPMTVRTVRTVTGTVWQATPPNSVILTMANRENQRFTIPKDQKFIVDGREYDAFGLRPGMFISATAVTTEVSDRVSSQANVTGTAPAPPPLASAPPAPPAPNVALLIVDPEPAPVATAGGAPAQLPRTGSPFPLIGLLGLALCGASAAIRMLQRS